MPRDEPPDDYWADSDEVEEEIDEEPDSDPFDYLGANDYKICGVLMDPHQSDNLEPPGWP